MTRAPLAYTEPQAQPERTAHEVWRVMAMSPAFGEFTLLIEQRLGVARDRYELNSANEGYRQRVLELREIHQFLLSGDLL